MASSSLSKAIKGENMTLIAVANELMSAAQKKFEEYATHESAQDSIWSEIGKKRKSAFDALLKKKKHI